MKLYFCSLTLEESLFFASKEVSQMYVTAPYLGNYALTYALHLASEEYRGKERPQYEEDFQSLDAYVFPAKFLEYRWTAQSFNSPGEGFYLCMGKNIVVDGMMRRRLQEEYGRVLEMGGRFPVFNSPQMGVLKMIAPESRAIFFVLSKEALHFPQFIRLGKFLAKCRVEASELSFEECAGPFLCSFPLNPVDLAREYIVRSYSVVSLKPVSLIEAVQVEGPYLRFEDPIGSVQGGFCLPSRVNYFLFKKS